MYWLPAILILPYIFLLLRIYRGLLNIHTFDVIVSPSTFISVVVACRNEKENLPHLLNCLEEQDYPKELFEVLIVDDNSTDKTYESASGFSGALNIVALHNEGKGKKLAIQTGINASSGELIITTDADCRMGKRWIRTIAAFYEKNRPDMIICPVQIESRRGLFGRFQELEFLSLQGITAGTLFSGKGTMCNGSNLSFTKESYLTSSNNLHFEINSGDDIFLLHSIKGQIHSKVLWLESSDSLVTAASAPVIESFIKQRKRWLSKAKAYNDTYTIFLGIVTFVTIVLQISLLITGFIIPGFWGVFIAVFLLKSIPDFFILMNTTRRYGRKELMYWFLPAQIVYPFYVLCVVFFSLISFGNKEY